MGQPQDQQINVLKSLTVEILVIKSGLRLFAAHEASLEAGLEIYLIQAMAKRLISLK